MKSQGEKIYIRKILMLRGRSY